MLRGQGREGAIGVGVKLNKDQIPDFDIERVVGIDEFGAAVAVRSEVDVQLGAGAARARVAHHPEVVFAVAGEDLLGGQVAFPKSFGFEVGFGFFVAAEVGGVDAVFGQAPDLRDQFPRPFDGFFFEIVAERPVAEHFEEGVVIGVDADIVEVVMFSASADAFLRIGGAAGGVGAVGLAEEDRYKLVHSRVGEEQVGGVGK